MLGENEVPVHFNDALDTGTDLVRVSDIPIRSDIRWSRISNIRFGRQAGFLMHLSKVHFIPDNLISDNISIGIPDLSTISVLRTTKQVSLSKK